MKKLIITSLVCLLSAYQVIAQSFPEGIPFQAQIFSQSGGILSSVTVPVRFNIRSASLTGTIVWQEDHIVTLNDLGHFSANIGTGLSTGAGTVLLFSDLPWSSNYFFVELLVDENSTGSFNSIFTQQLMAVPFAYHSKTTSQQFALSQLQDVDTSGIQVGDILKWNGTAWVPSSDNIAVSTDTVNFAYSSSNAVYADTAVYAMNCIYPSLVDSSNYAYQADSSNYAAAGYTANYANTADYASTAGVANYSIGNWGIHGNDNVISATHFIGTIDSVDLVFKSYNQEKMRIKANGRIGIGTSAPLNGFHVSNVNGTLFTGTHGVGSIPVQGAGSRMMWYPAKSAFRSGYVTSTLWDNVFIGEYSFAAGYNAEASGSYSVAFGINTSASGEGAFVAGKGSVATGDYSIALGENPEAQGDYGVAIGRGAKANAYGSVAMGYHPEVYGNYGLSLGNYTTVTGQNGVAIGYHAQCLHDGSFIFSDQSDPIGFTPTTAANQFMVKASGGFVFYTNATLTTGVTLAPGAGAWSTLSDRNSKHNIDSINPDEYLEKLDSIDVFTWNYISQDTSIRHIGPMAQDFYQVFQFGTDSTVINSGDFDGLNLVLLKALYMKMEELNVQEAQLTELNMELELLREERRKLELLLVDLENRVIAIERETESSQTN